MKILVTGGTGFVGSHLVRELLKEKENSVYALIRDAKKLESSEIKGEVTVIAGDLFSSEVFPADIELVFHLAALTKVISPEEFTQCNHDGTRLLMEKLRPLTKLRKVVLLSSLAAIGPNRQNHLLREDMPENPVSLYGKSKLAQEKIFRELCPAPYIIVRAPIVFGPGDLDMLTIFRIIRKGILPTLGKQERRYSVIYVKDLIRGMIVAASSSCQNETINIANTEAIDWEKFMLAASLLMGRKKIKKVVIPEMLVRFLAGLSEIIIHISRRKNIFNRDKFREMRFPVWTCSVEKSQRLLHFQCLFPFKTALGETIHWYQEQNLL
ncbi:NAD(P)-dependent oxidoreductase [candidate division KSB1 bacterium]|nr:NAD(P)-dependent oxidoreductase [Candidatus Aminicenantes bacterium]RQW03598.1 MAG: NAD(P)-dependent oxidoreductase [candidate division KSB1 bacterium]